MKCLRKTTSEPYLLSGFLLAFRMFTHEDEDQDKKHGNHTKASHNSSRGSDEGLTIEGEDSQKEYCDDGQRNRDGPIHCSLGERLEI